MKPGKNGFELPRAAAGLLAVILVFTWPLALHLGEAVPQGSEPSAVAVFQLFSVEWTGAVLDRGAFAEYWNAPFFYPYRGTFAWCEPQPAFCAAAWLIARLAGYLAAYNILLILFLVGFGLSGYALCRLLTDDRLAAFWCGAWLAAGAYSLQQICAPALIAGAFPLGCIYFSLRCAREKRSRYFWLAVCAYVLSWASAKQIAFYLTLLLPVILFPLRRNFSWSMKSVGCAVSAAALTLGTILPYSLAQFSFLKPLGLAHPLERVQGVLSVSDLFTPAQGHWLATRLLNRQGYSWDIGIVCTAVIVAALIVRLARRDRGEPLSGFQKGVLTGLCAMTLAALAFGFGPRLGMTVGGRQYSPYTLLFSFLPGLQLIRSPARIVLFSIAGCAVFSGVALAYLRSAIPRPRLRGAVTAGLFLTLSLEMWSAPIPLVYPGRELSSHRAVIAWLRENAGDVPLLEIGRFVHAGKQTRDLEAWAMYRSLRHSAPLINGYATFYPLTYLQLKKAFREDPAGRFRRYLAACGARLVLVHHHELVLDQAGIFHDAAYGAPVYRDTGHEIYRIGSAPPAGEYAVDLPHALQFAGLPQQGRLYALPLAHPFSRAVRLPREPEWPVDFIWQANDGERMVRRVEMRGSVFLDVGERAIYFRLARFSAGRGRSEALLVAAEEVAAR